MKLKCNKCLKMKHDTAFQFKIKRFLFWKYWSFELDTRECLDCKYPHRWDKIRESLKDMWFPVK